MRVFLFFGFITLSVWVTLTSLSDVQAGTQDSVNKLSAQNAAIMPDGHDVEQPAQIIQKQLKAFRDLEAEDAYALTSPGLRQQYRDADHFLMMMRFTYQPLTAHLSYSFIDATTIGDSVIHKVEMLNKDGSSVLVLYKLIRDENHLWVIDGYTILDKDAQPI